jgi:hypothetical protein
MSTLLKVFGKEFTRFRKTKTPNQLDYARICKLKDASEISKMEKGGNLHLDIALKRINCAGGLLIIVNKPPRTAKPDKMLNQLLKYYTEDQILLVLLNRRKKTVKEKKGKFGGAERRKGK